MFFNRVNRKNLIIMSLVVSFSACSSAGAVFKCSFAKDKWDPNDWTVVKSPRWEHFGKWIQKDTHIENWTPSDATPDEIRSTRAAETYTSMVLKRQISGEATITSTMEFADRMAPLIVIASGLSNEKGRAEHREHFEVVIFDKGVNVWHHYFKNGKASWKKTAYSRFELKPNVKYEVKVKISPSPQGKMLSVTIDNHEFGYIDDSLPDNFYVGITGCEGVNRFYDFTVEKKKQD